MQCPVCQINLRKTQKREVVFQLCDECRGIWIAAKELEVLANALAKTSQSSNELPTGFKPREIDSVSPGQDMRLCPECRCTLKEFNFAYDSNIMIDKCSTCSGIWMDANEINQIARHIQANPEAESLGNAICGFQKKQDDLKKDKYPKNTFYGPSIC